MVIAALTIDWTLNVFELGTTVLIFVAGFLSALMGARVQAWFQRYGHHQDEQGRALGPIIEKLVEARTELREVARSQTNVSLKPIFELTRDAALMFERVWMNPVADPEAWKAMRRAADTVLHLSAGGYPSGDVGPDVDASRTARQDSVRAFDNTVETLRDIRITPRPWPKTKRALKEWRSSHSDDQLLRSLEETATDGPHQPHTH